MTMLLRFLSIASLVIPAEAWAPQHLAKSSTRLFRAPQNAPKHDVGSNPMADFTPEQLERATAYMEHQQNVPKPGFPTDVRSLVQYNHGFAVMSTNSKS